MTLKQEMDMMTRLVIAVTVLAALLLPAASSAQCPVEPGWWVYKAPDNSVKLKFHVKPEGAAVDSLEFTLHSVCAVSGTRRYTSAGKPITCNPWGFAWSVSCDVPSWTDGMNLWVTFTDAQHSDVVLDVVMWFEGCVVCRALETAGCVGTAVSTWGGIKSLYDSP
jgi:hypothetical protein